MMLRSQFISFAVLLWRGRLSALIVVASVIATVDTSAPLAHLVLTASATDVCGSISTNTTWDAANSPYAVTCDITVSPDSTLTIEQGVEVRFNLGRRLAVAGRLVATGTQAEPVVMTSAATSPAKGDWRGILATADGARVDLEYTDVRYAGADYGSSYISPAACAIDTYSVYSPGGTSSVADAEVSLSHVTVEHNLTCGVRVGYGTLTATNSTFSDSSDKSIWSFSSTTNVSNSTLGDGSNYGLYENVSGASLTLHDNTFEGSVVAAAYISLGGLSTFDVTGNVATGNGRNAFQISGGPSTSLTLPNNPRMPYYSGGLTVGAAVTLTLPPGTVLKFLNGSIPGAQLNVAGVLEAQGTAASPVVLTSFKDDEAAGDSNGDQGGSQPAKGDWRGILATADGARVDLEYTDVRYAGADYGSSYISPAACAIDTYSVYSPGGTSSVADAEVSLSHVTVEHNLTCGVRVGYGTLTATNSTFSDSSDKSIWSFSSTTNVSNSTLGDGSNYGLYENVSGASLTLHDNTFEGSVVAAAYISLGGLSTFDVTGNVATGNGRNAFQISGGPSTSLTLPNNPRMPYYSGGLTVGAAVTLTLPPGTVLKFLNGSIPWGATERCRRSGGPRDSCQPGGSDQLQG